MTIEIILEIILVLIGLYLAMFKSYFQEKGKSIATSEHIKDLTFKVESVRQEFTEKNANIRAKLDLLTNLKTSYKNEERLALISFHKNLKIWIGLLTESFPALIDDSDDVEILTKMHSYDQNYRQFLASEALLEIYITDEKLDKLITELKLKVLEVLTPHPIKFLVDIRFNNFLKNQLQDQPNDETKMEHYKILSKERMEIHSNYSKNMIEGYKQVVGIEKNYREYLREFIEKILTD